MIKLIPSFKTTSSKKFLFLVCFVLATFFNGNTQNYVNITLGDPMNSGLPLQNGASSEYLINASSGTSGIGIGWCANLYSASEMGASNKIYDLTWISNNNTSTSNQTFDFKDVEVWMYHFNSDAFTDNNRPNVQSGNIVGASNITKVASGKSLIVKTPSPGRCIFTLNLDTPFDYIAGNNLVIYLEKKTPYSPSINSGPVFMHNTDATNKKRRICNWADGTLSSPLPTSHNSFASQKSFARVLFNVAYTNTIPLDGVNGATGNQMTQCLPPVCTTPVISNKTTSICSNSALNFSPTATGTDLIPSGTSYKWTFTDNPNLTGEANETIGKISISSTSNLINTTNTPQDVVYTVTPSSSTCVGTPFSLTVTVYPVPKISNITKSICSGASFDTIPVATATNTNIIPTGTTYTWTKTPPAGITGVTNGTDQTKFSQTLTNTTNASINVVYTLTAKSGTSTNQCTGNFDITVTVKPIIAKPDTSGIVQPTCFANGSLNLNNYSASNTYVFIPSTDISLITTSTPKKISGKTGTYKFVSSNNGCSSDTLKIEFKAPQGAAFLETTPSVPSLCVGDSLVIKAWTDNTKSTKSTPKSNPAWLSDNDYVTLKDTVNGSFTIKKVIAKVGGTSKITYTDVNGCETSLNITINSIPNVAPITGADSVCAANFTTLSNATPGGTWSSTDPMIGGMTPTGDFQTKQPGEVMVYYTVTSPAGCSAKAQKKMIVKVTEDVIFNHPEFVCVSSILQLNPSIKGGVWTNTNPQFGSVSYSMFIPNSNSTYNVAVLKYEPGKYNCFFSKYSYIKIHPEPKIVGNAKSICVGDTTTFKDIENRDPLNQKTSWSLPNYTDATIDQKGVLRAINSGGSEVIGKNVYGCSSQGWIDIRPAALFDDTTINVCSGVETSLIPIIKNASSSLNPTFKWSVTNNTIVDGENEMLSLVPAFKQTLINKSGSDQTVNYLLYSNVGTGTDACLTTRKLNVVVNSALDIVGPANMDLSKQIQYTAVNNSGNLLTWSTSNPQVIMVNPTGLVSPKGVGSAILSVTNQFGCTAQMNINVSDNQKISGLNVVCEGSQLALNGFGTPKAVDPWTSANTSILTINTNGQVTGIKAGKSLVSYFNDQGQKDTMTVFVKTTPVVDLIQDYNICPGYFADGIKFNGTMGASFEWKNNIIATGLLPEGIQQISPFDAINNGSTNLISEITVTPRLGECLGASKKFNLIVRFIPKLKITQIDTIVCPGGNINFKTELTPAVTSPIYQWTVNGAKVGVNSSIYWSNALKSNDKITVNLSGKDFCPTSANLFVRMDSLRLSMQVPNMLYLKDPAINLVGYPVGGTFSGKGITNNKLDPSVAGVGNKMITYSFKNANNCIGTINQKVVIYDTVFNNCHLTTYDTVTVTDTVSILKIKFKLTTGIKANQETTMRVYPNPTSDILVIEATDEKALAGYRYKIRDVAGKEVYSQPVKAALTQISLKSLGAAGTYFFEVYDEKLQRQVTKKIILE